jgi:hypothetical protein
MKSINPDTGEVEDGNWCELCKYVDNYARLTDADVVLHSHRKSGLPHNKAFFTGGISTLCSHIHRSVPPRVLLSLIAVSHR